MLATGIEGSSSDERIERATTAVAEVMGFTAAINREKRSPSE